MTTKKYVKGREERGGGEEEKIFTCHRRGATQEGVCDVPLHGSSGGSVCVCFFWLSFFSQKKYLDKRLISVL